VSAERTKVCARRAACLRSLPATGEPLLRSRLAGSPRGVAARPHNAVARPPNWAIGAGTAWRDLRRFGWSARRQQACGGHNAPRRPCGTPAVPFGRPRSPPVRAYSLCRSTSVRGACACACAWRVRALGGFAMLHIADNWSASQPVHNRKLVIRTRCATRKLDR
jgi:hypothetical protein